MAGAPSQQDMMQQNMQARALLLNTARLAEQKVIAVNNSQYPYTAGQATTINVPLLPTGLIKRLFILITANVQQGAAETQTLAPMGPANFLSNITLTDLNNIQRVNTSGWHLSMVSSARRVFPQGAAITSDTPLGYGANNNVIKAPATVTSANNVYMAYELPLAYSDTDCRGAIFANTVQATLNLSMTINPNLFVASGADNSFAMYRSSTAQLGKINSYTITVYQEYWDQLPMANGSPILPLVDLATMYQLIGATYTGIVANTEFSIPYQAYRQYMSTIAVYDNGGTLNTGSDVNTWTMSTANALTLFKRDPQLCAYRSRLQFNDDQPPGTYYFDHRAAPINTYQQGVTQLSLNASTVNANAAIYAGFEFFALINQLNQAGSITSQ